MGPDKPALTGFHKRLLLILVITLVVILSTGCASVLSGDAQSVSLPPYAPSTISLSEVFFWVEVPPDTPDNAQIQVMILDEVTGLTRNPQYVNLLKVDETHYGNAVRLRLGSVVKYRYIRQNGEVFDEFTPDWLPIRYRMIYVDGPDEVHDIVARWEDTAFTGATGRISGTITNADNGAPIPDMLVLAGGEQTLTDIHGAFSLDGIPVGQQHLLAYSLDGLYQPVKQNVVVAEDAETPVRMQVKASPLVEVTFRVTVPKDTVQGVPLRIAGNLLPFGNTFADLGGGISGLAGAMPQLTAEDKTHYSVKMSLPAGAYVQYKYTLGDGYWNAEHADDQSFAVREIIIPEGQAAILVQDRVKSWQSSKAKPILFEFKAPDYTPQAEQVYLQFFLDEWMSPLPMWAAGEDLWAFQLLSPTSVPGGLRYRYCRNAQCGQDYVIAGEFVDADRQTETDFKRAQTISDTINSWRHLQVVRQPVDMVGGEVQVRDAGFVAGIGLIPGYDPSWALYMQSSMDDIVATKANTVVLSPTWTVTRNSPPHFEPVLGQDMLVATLAQQIRAAQQRGLKVVLYPRLQADSGIIDWWAHTPYDNGWWRVWFEQYHKFMLNFADIAQTYQVDGLVMGGEWISPALPANDPPDFARDRWLATIEDVNNAFDGEMIWQQYYGNDLSDAPGFIERFDVVYLEWGATLGTYYGAEMKEVRDTAGSLLNKEVKPFKDKIKKPLVISLAYPSAQGGVTNCIYETTTTDRCIPFELLSPLFPDRAEVALDLDGQALVYNAVMAEINKRQWVDGVVSEGYYPPVRLEDKSVSVQGKPAQEVLIHWFTRFLGQ